MNMANLLSLSRIPLGLIGLLAMVNERPLFFNLALILGIVTDFLDGRVAKYQNKTSGLGKLLDLICDQFFELFLALGLYLTYEFPSYYFFIVGSRVSFSLILIYKKREEILDGPVKRELRIHSILSLIVFFFFGFALSIQLEAPPLAAGLLTIALPYVLVPIGALMEVMTVMGILPQLFSQRG